MFGKNVLVYRLGAGGGELPAPSLPYWYLTPYARSSQAGIDGTSSRTGGSVSRKNEPQVRVLVFRCHNLLFKISWVAIVPPGELCGIEQPGSSPGP